MNDGLLFKQDEEEDHTSLTSARVKDSSGDGDYYVNDDLFPNSTSVQTAQSSNHSDEELTNAVSEDKMKTSLVIMSNLIAQLLKFYTHYAHSKDTNTNKC